LTASTAARYVRIVLGRSARRGAGSGFGQGFWRAPRATTKGERELAAHSIAKEESTMDIIRAWKDPIYRESLSAGLPDNPAGRLELSDEQLRDASGIRTGAVTTCICCTDTNRTFRCCP
jgi:mersacidin/lichenicidin family type 2 lantibiotic